MSRFLMMGLTSAALGLFLGAAQGVSSGSLLAFLSLFALITLLGTLTAAVVYGRHVHDDPDGYVGFGDDALALGTLVVVVEGLFFGLSGELLAIVLMLPALGLTYWALKQERQVAIAVAGVMSVLALSWVITSADAIIIGTVPALLWIFSAGAYAASLASGEQVGGAVTS